MRNFIGKNSVNKVCILIPICHPGNKQNLRFLVCIQVFCFKIFTSFPKKIAMGGDRKEAKGQLDVRCGDALQSEPSTLQCPCRKISVTGSIHGGMFLCLQFLPG